MSYKKIQNKLDLGKNLTLAEEEQRRIYEKIQNKSQIVIYALMCPNYPHNGKQFIYKNEKMTPGLPFNTHRYIKYINKKHNSISAKADELGKKGTFDVKESILVKPLVCEIESDIEKVAATYGHSQKSFEDIVAQTSQIVESELKKEFSQVDGGTFYSHLPTLQECQKIVSQIDIAEIPQDFLNYVEDIATQRADMFRHLYGAKNQSENHHFAYRQMSNYLAASKAISQEDPGALVINAKTPNRVYVEHPLLPKTIGHTQHQIPNFTFFG